MPKDNVAYLHNIPPVEILRELLDWEQRDNYKKIVVCIEFDNGQVEFFGSHRQEDTVFLAQRCISYLTETYDE